MAALATKDGVPVWREMGRTPVDPAARRFDVVVVGGGPVGLTVALDLGRRGHRVAVLNKLDFITGGSKAICFAKRTLDIWNRLGIGQAIVNRGVVWNVGKVFRGDDPDPVYSFDMLPVKSQQMPGFVNLQQYHVEDILIGALAALPNVDLRWGHEVIGIDQHDEGAVIAVRTGQGADRLETEWVIACDGSRSSVREMLGLDFDGRIFEDNFLIADIRIEGDRPAERWFWFDPPFNPGQSALLHKQPDNVWRLDFQLGWNVDRAASAQPENVTPLVRGMLGEDCAFEAIWYSVYTFQCRRMARFVHDRVIFAGDSAHLVSPFGARGCNGGIADADNLGWKLDLVINGRAPATLLETYDEEAIAAADENILNSSRSTDFMTPKSAGSRILRDAVLALARDHAFARPLVNSGRLSTAVTFAGSSLNTEDEPGACWSGIAPGSVALDAPVDGGWLLEHFAAGDFVLLACGADSPIVPGVRRVLVDDVGDPQHLVMARYDLGPSSAYLIRPDQYVAARWREPNVAAIVAAVDRARGVTR